MSRLTILLAVLALPACADLALPSQDTAMLMRGCEARPPVGDCAVTRGALVIRYRKRF